MEPLPPSRSLRRTRPDLVSVIIPVLNTGHHLGQQLSALAHQDYDGSFEVILADNGSTDDSVAIAQHWSSVLDVRVVDASRKRGIGVATNCAVREASAPLLALLDDDDVASSDWLGQLVAAALETDAVVGALEPESLNSPRAQRWRHWDNSGGLKVGYNFLPFGATCNMGIWRETIEALGGFSESNPAIDVDFCWRAQLAGFRLGFAPSALVHYRFKDRISDFARQQYLYGRSGPYLYRDFHEFGQMRQLGQACWVWFQMPLRALKAIFVPTIWGRLIGDIAFRVGRIVGSVQCRRLYL